jgi:polysaccharide export outer membrane protein
MVWRLWGVLVLCMAGLWVSACSFLLELAPPSETSSLGVSTEAPGAWPGEDYALGPGDVLDISVWKDEALTRTVSITPDGRISFPLIGEIQASGRTLSQLKGEMEERLKPFVPEPVLSVSVRQVNSMIVYVLGRVNNPGRFALTTNVNVLQALAMAGGLNPFASRNEIKVFRQENGQNIVIPFRYDEVAKGVRLEQNIWLKRGDVLLIP